MERLAPPSAHVDKLRACLVDDIIHALGLSVSDRRHRLFARLFHAPCQRFAQVGATFDGWVARHGLQEAARRFLPRFISDYIVSGVDRIPSTGPVVIASNDLGTYDSAVIAASVIREDLKIVASNMPFVRSLPALRERVFFATTDTQQRFALVREAIRHLREGGALLIFPSGHIDPDPDVLPNADKELGTWSPSVALMMRRAPATQLVVTIVSGVLARSVSRTPLMWLRKGNHEKRRLAEFLQVMQQLLLDRTFSLIARASFGEPTTIAELGDPRDTKAVNAAIIQRARRLLGEHTAQLAA